MDHVSQGRLTYEQVQEVARSMTPEQLVTFRQYLSPEQLAALLGEKCTTFWCELGAHGQAMAVPFLQSIVIMVGIGLIFWHPKSPVQWIIARFADEMLEIARRLRGHFTGSTPMHPNEAAGAMISLGFGSLGTALVVSMVLSTVLTPWK